MTWPRGKGRGEGEGRALIDCKVRCQLHGVHALEVLSPHLHGGLPSSPHSKQVCNFTEVQTVKRMCFKFPGNYISLNPLHQRRLETNSRGGCPKSIPRPLLEIHQISGGIDVGKSLGLYISQRICPQLSSTVRVSYVAYNLGTTRWVQPSCFFPLKTIYKAT